MKIQFRAAARIGLGDGMSLIFGRKRAVWEPSILSDRFTGGNIDVPSSFVTNEQTVAELESQYVTWLFNELHSVLGKQGNTEFEQAIDAMHHDYQDSKDQSETRNSNHN